MEEITKQEWNLILESLNYTKRAYEDYTHYPTYDFKQQQIKFVSDLIIKIRQTAKEAQ